jgi:hypothetical protein
MLMAVQKNGVVCLAKKKHPKDIQYKEKVVPVADSYFGIHGTTAVCQAIEHYFRERKGPVCFTSVDDVFKEFLALHHALESDYNLPRSSARNEPFERLSFETILINRYGIFSVSKFHCVFEYTKFFVIGNGCDYALVFGIS